MPSTEGNFTDGLAGALLSARDLRCRRGGLLVLAGLSFELRRGELLELRGANGSGKTTLLRVLAGLSPHDGGALSVEGRPVRPGDAAHARCTGYLGHHDGLSADLTAIENLRFARRLDGTSALHRKLATKCVDDISSLAEALEAWGLDLQAHQAVRRLSQGQRRRLALARVSMGRRPLWLLDEPCAGLDAEGERLFDQHLTDHLCAGGCAVVATHRALDVPAELLHRLDLHCHPRPNAARSAWTEDASAAC